MGLFSWFSKKKQSTPPALPPIGLREEEGFVDITLPLHSYQPPSDGTQRIVAKGLHGQHPVGFAVVFPADDWEERPVNREEPGHHKTASYSGWVRFESLGQESDAWLFTLRTLYGLEPNPAPMLPAVTFTAVTVEGDPRAPKNGLVKIKLFHECDLSDPDFHEKCAEFYLNIDMAAKRVEFHEKEAHFRKAVVKAFTKETVAQS